MSSFTLFGVLVQAEQFQQKVCNELISACSWLLSPFTACIGFIKAKVLSHVHDTRFLARTVQFKRKDIATPYLAASSISFESFLLHCLKFSCETDSQVENMLILSHAPWVLLHFCITGSFWLSEQQDIRGGGESLTYSNLCIYIYI